MDINAITEKILEEVFCDNGVFIDDKSILLADYLPDSLSFVNIIIGIEEAFNIELPDEMLMIENFGTFESLVANISHLLDQTEASNV